VIAVNLVGTAAVVRAALPFLERMTGRVVTVNDPEIDLEDVRRSVAELLGG
jgi:hypothetical protein